VEVFRPQGPGPFPVVFLLHGRAPNRDERRAMDHPIAAGHAQWWLRQGVAVIAPVRPGYGTTGGPDMEDTTARWHGATCSGEPDFMRPAASIARSTSAVYAWALRQPWVRKDRLLVEGWSMGGLGSISVAALNPPGVRGVINFSGGTAGNPTDAPGRSCRPDLLAQTYEDLGRRARVPSLWLYAENDRYWGEQAPKTWFEAYRAGGSETRLVVTPAVEGEDGHQLLMDGAPMWMGPVRDFIRRVGFVEES
jgi:dienelactone hydrolase